MSFGPSGRLPSVMGHTFSQVPRAEIQRSSFDRSHGYKTTIDAGYLYPILVDEVLPGDTVKCSGTLFGRINTPIKPIMDNLYMDTFFFFVPYRLLWTNFKRFMGEQDNPTDSTDFAFPKIAAPASPGYAEGSLADYMGLPVGRAARPVATYDHAAAPFRAYNLIWNQWFRDENLQTSVTVDTGDGPDVTAYTLLKRGKRHDYFTSCLPWPQKGTAVQLPLGSSAPVTGIGKWDTTYALAPITVYETGKSAPSTWAHGAIMHGGGSADQLWYGKKDEATGYPDIRADLSAATAATINQIRQAFQIQRLYERDARGGTRYTEIVRSHFGVVSPDARLQRPEYLGGGSSPITMAPVAQTAPAAGGSTPQGNLAAMGTVTAHGHGFTKSFTEHGVLLGLVSVRADLNYQQGLNRMWSRRSRWDFYWPALAHLGEQAVLKKEIYCDGSSTDAETFGYQERYAEYRYKPSQVTGKFRSTSATPLDVWHLAQDFASCPTLGPTFIVENPPMSRVVAVPSEPIFNLDCYFKYIWARPMPVFGVPGFMDHF